MNSCPKCNTGNYDKGTGCNSCGAMPKGCPVPCKGEWIDTYLLSKKWGKEDSCTGIISDRYIPGFLINYCPETPENSKGYQDPCNKDFYYKVIDNYLYRMSYGCDGLIATQTFIKDVRVQDCAIKSIDGTKITNPCGFFRNSGGYTDINDPTKGYLIDNNGETSLNPGIILLDNVITNDCKIRTVLKTQDVRRNLFNDLACLGVQYNSVNDTVFVDTGILVDNETLKAEIPVSGGCKKLRLNYIDSDTINFSQSASGFTGEVKFQDTPSIDISKDGNGLKADLKIVDSPTIDLTITPNGLTADLRPCPGINAGYLDFSDNAVILNANHRTSGTSTLYPDESAYGENGGQIGQPTPFLTNNVSFSFTSPALPAGCDPDFYWLYMINTQSGGDLSTTNNAIVTFNCQMKFNNSSIINKTGDIIILRRYPNNTTGFNADQARDREDSANNTILIPTLNTLYGEGYGDSQGRRGANMFFAAIRPGTSISGQFEQLCAFPNSRVYSQISVPIIGANVPLNRWFGESQATLLRIGKIKQSTLPTN